MREVNREIRRLCGGTDRALAQLKRKYAMDQVVLERLSEFDAQIEANNIQQPKAFTTKLPK
jgi:16S rRNA U516 pseudouridylate synthase RsuA-like enzyme